MSAFKKVRRFVLVAMLTIIGIVVGGLVVINALFVINSVPERRMTPPAGMLHLPQPAGQPARKLVAPSITNRYLEDQIRADQKSPASGIYIDLRTRLGKCTTDYAKVFRGDETKYGSGSLSSSPSESEQHFDNWKKGEPLTAEQVRWLKEHHDLIEDLLKIHAAGGVPKITCESAAQYDGDALSRMQHNTPVHWVFLTGAEILMCESRRLRAEGNQQAAADALLAMDSWAYSYSEPLLGELRRRVRLKKALFLPGNLLLDR